MKLAISRCAEQAPLWSLLSPESPDIAEAAKLREERSQLLFCIFGGRVACEPEMDVQVCSAVHSKVNSAAQLLDAWRPLCERPLFC